MPFVVVVIGWVSLFFPVAAVVCCFCRFYYIFFHIWQFSGHDFNTRATANIILGMAESACAYERRRRTMAEEAKKTQQQQ